MALNKIDNLISDKMRSFLSYIFLNEGPRNISEVANWIDSYENNS